MALSDFKLALNEICRDQGIDSDISVRTQVDRVFLVYDYFFK